MQRGRAGDVKTVQGFTEGEERGRRFKATRKGFGRKATHLFGCSGGCETEGLEGSEGLLRCVCLAEHFFFLVAHVEAVDAHVAFHVRRADERAAGKAVVGRGRVPDGTDFDLRGEKGSQTSTLLCDRVES